MAEPLAESSNRLVTVARAATATEVHRLSLVLGAAEIPFFTTNNLAHILGGSSYNAAFGPVAFKVPVECVAAAESALAEAYDVRPELVPERCPACEAPTQRGRLDCPACGLFLA